MHLRNIYNLSQECNVITKSFLFIYIVHLYFSFRFRWKCIRMTNNNSQSVWKYVRCCQFLLCAFEDSVHSQSSTIPTYHNFFSKYSTPFSISVNIHMLSMMCQFINCSVPIVENITFSQRLNYIISTIKHVSLLRVLYRENGIFKARNGRFSSRRDQYSWAMSLFRLTIINVVS